MTAKPLTDEEIDRMERSALVEIDCLGSPYATDVVRLAGDLRKARELLRKVEWVHSEDFGEDVCPVCVKPREQAGREFGGHESDCELAAFLGPGGGT